MDIVKGTVLKSALGAYNRWEVREVHGSGHSAIFELCAVANAKCCMYLPIAMLRHGVDTGKIVIAGNNVPGSM